MYKLKKVITNPFLWIAILVSMLLLWKAISGTDLVYVWRALLHTKFFLVLLAIILKICIFLFMSLRWHLLFPPNGPSFRELFSHLVVGTLPNFIFVNMGPLPRLFFLKKFSKTGYSYGVATLLIEKIMDILVLALLILLAFVFTPIREWVVHPQIIEIALFVCLLFSLCFVIFPQKFDSIIKALSVSHCIQKYSKIKSLLEYNHRVWHYFQESKLLRMKILGCTVSIIVLNVIIVYVIFLSMNIKASLAVAFLLQVSLLMGNRIPSIAGIGVFQYICILVLTEISIDQNTAFVFSLVLYFVLKMPSLVLGVVILPSYNNNRLKYY